MNDKILDENDEFAIFEQINKILDRRLGKRELSKEMYRQVVKEFVAILEKVLEYNRYWLKNKPIEDMKKRKDKVVKGEK